jgi:hypothetical protein
MTRPTIAYLRDYAEGRYLVSVDGRHVGYVVKLSPGNWYAPDVDFTYVARASGNFPTRAAAAAELANALRGGSS